MSERDAGARTVRVETSSRAYDVVVGAGVLDATGRIAREAAGGERCCVVTDSNVEALYAARVERSLAEAGYDVAERLAFPAGERSKTISTLGELLEGLARRELTRSDVVIALGGGVTGDMAGLSALPAWRSRRPGADLALGDGRLVGRRQDRRRPLGGQEPRWGLLAAQRGRS